MREALVQKHVHPSIYFWQPKQTVQVDLGCITGSSIVQSPDLPEQHNALFCQDYVLHSFQGSALLLPGSRCP